MESVRTPVNASVTPAMVGLRFGLLIGLVSIVISFVFLSIGLQDSWWKSLLSVIVLVGGIVLAQRQFKKQNAGFMSYGEGLGVALIAGCVMGLLNALFLYAYVTVIEPDFQQTILNKAREGMEARGNMDDAKIDQAMSMTSKFMMPIMIGSVLLVTAFQSLIVGLISSAFVKNVKPEFE